MNIGLFRSPGRLKFYPCFPEFDLFKSAYTLVGYVTFKKTKPALQGENFNGKAKVETVPIYKQSINLYSSKLSGIVVP